MTIEQPKQVITKTCSVVTVGDGRGFVVAGKRERYVVTAGHCLPTAENGHLLLPCVTFSFTHERTCGSLLGPLGVDLQGWLMALDGHWFRCDLAANDRALSFMAAAEPGRHIGLAGPVGRWRGDQGPCHGH
jgi:hypothetical protein